MRFADSDLVFPDDHGTVERAWICDDTRHKSSDVFVVRYEHKGVAVLHHRPRHVLDQLRHGAAQGSWEEDLHPPANVDESMGQFEVPYELSDGQFLRSPK